MNRNALQIMFATFFLSCLSSVSLQANADTQQTPPSKNIKHVIYITLDGVRWQDIYGTHRYFKKLWNEHANQLHFYGLPNSKTTMEVASIPVSLPSYQSQMSGTIQACHDNKCGRIQVKTLPEYLIDQLHFAKKDVAIFSSWPEISHAIESKNGTAYSNVGNLSAIDPLSSHPDGVMKILNHAQETDHPSYKPNRYDKYTFLQALHYFEKYQPRFLWISLVNADDEAHAAHLSQYHQLLSYYDDALDGLFTTLKTMKLDKNTMVIVTTDHGRGNDENWTSHGEKFPESRQTWALVMNGELQPMSKDDDVYHYNTLSIRPTIENAFNS